MKQPPTHRIWRQLHPWSLIKQTWQSFQDNQLHGRCAQFAYYSMLGLFPLLMVTISVIALLPLDGMLDNLYSLMERYLPEDVTELLVNQARSIDASTSTGLILVNVAVFSFAGARLFVTISEGLNAAFGLPNRYKRIRTFGISSILPIISALAFLLGLALLVIAPLLIHWMIDFLEMEKVESALIHSARWIVMTGFLFVFTASLYSFVPARKIRWRVLTPGNVFAVAGWLTASQGFKLYVDNFGNYDKTYGTLGGAVVLLLWLYLVGAILFIGGQINGVIYAEPGRPANPELVPQSDSEAGKN